MMKVKITSKLETSDHDGYCSGEECEYECKIITHIIDIPKKYKLYPKGTINLDEDDFDWVNLLPEPELNTDESYYCDNSYESENHGLEKHDYRYTIQSVEIIDIDEIDENDEK